jgi:signal peptidase I
VVGTDIYRSVVAGQHRKERRKRLFKIFLRLSLLLLLVVAGLLGIGLYRLAGESMAPGLHAGDLVVVNKAAYGLVVPFKDQVILGWGKPKLGDVVLVSLPRPDAANAANAADIAGKGRIAFKRVVGRPGDRIQVSSGRLVLNGKPAGYQLISPRAVREWPAEKGAQYEAETFEGSSHQIAFLVPGGTRAPSGMLTVPPEHYFLLGDSRDNSEDSRTLGPIPRDRILGRLGGVLWP